MKPQIVVQDLGGAHNADVFRARSRIVEGATWKKQRVVVVLPSANLLPAKVALSHWNIIFPPNQPVMRALALGMEVGDAYSTTIEQIIADAGVGSWEYILTIEHDNTPPPDGLLKLIAAMEAHPEYACIGGLYYTKGFEGVPQIWGDPKDPMLNFRPQPPVPDQIVECCGTGMGFNLWRMSMFKDARLRRPWFKTIAGAEGVGTQDLYAWGDFRKYGYRCAVHCGVKVGHYDHENDMVW